MNSSSPQPDSKPRRHASDRDHDCESAALEQIDRLLGTQRIDLEELVKAICAVPGFPHHFRRMVSESCTEFETISDAAVLAGRSGIRMILCDYLHTSHANGRAALFVHSHKIFSEHKPSSTKFK